jgi:hypothetical protein
MQAMPPRCHNAQRLPLRLRLSPWHRSRRKAAWRATTTTPVLLLLALLVFEAGCNDDTPVAAFERLYAASAAREPALVRAALCAPLAQSLDGVSDEELVGALRVRRVVRSIEAVSGPVPQAVKDTAPPGVKVTMLIVTDSQGDTQQVATWRLPNGRHCVAALGGGDER